MNFEEWWIEFEKIMSNFSDEKFIFRGQADEEWELKTSFQREKEDNKNYDLITAVKDFEIFLAKENKYPFEEKKDIYEWLRLGQHYGLATPYLDFSKSPYVSLFFASSEELKKDGKLFVLDIDKFLYEFVKYFLDLERIENIFRNTKTFYIKQDFREKTINSIKEKLKNNTPILEAFIEYVEKIIDTRKINKNLEKDLEKEDKEDLEDISEINVLKDLKKELQKELTKNGIVEDEIFFYPKTDENNDRMKRQQGCFIYCMLESKNIHKFVLRKWKNKNKLIKGIMYIYFKIRYLKKNKGYLEYFLRDRLEINLENPKFEKDKVLYEIIIPAKYKKDILNKLNKMNISNVTLFGDEEYAVKDAKLGLEHNLKIRNSKIELKG